MDDERRYPRLGETYLKRERWDTRPVRAEELQPGALPAAPRSSGCERPWFVFVPVAGSVHPDGRQVFQRVPMGCRKCGFCRGVRRDSLAAAVSAEVRAASWSFFLTLTISPTAAAEHPLMDKLLDTAEHSKFMKRLRMNAKRGLGSSAGRNVGNIRFLMCGELGKLHGRAHYHYLIWGDGDAPNIPEGRMVDLPEWQFGHVCVVPEVSEAHARYVTKYLTKSDATRGVDFIMSRSRSVGGEQAYERGYALAEMGATVPTHSFSWAWRDITGKLRSAVMRGAQRRWFLKGFMDATGLTVDDLFKVMPMETHGELRRIVREEAERALKVTPTDEFMQEMQDDIRRASEAQFAEERAKAARSMASAKPDPRWTPERDGVPLSFDEAAENERLRREWAASRSSRDASAR